VTELELKRKASELLAKARYADAIALYQNLIASTKKKNPAILNLIGDIHVKQSEFESAFEHYLEASRLYAEDGLFHNAIAVGKKILRLDRDQTEVYGLLGNLYARQGLGMDCIKFLNEYARRKEALDEYAAALASYAEACEILADCAEVHIAYGGMLERVGRKEDAGIAYRSASQVFREKGQLEAAEQWARRAGADEDDVAAAEAEAEDDGEVQSVADLMNLKMLDDDAPAKPARPARPARSAADDKVPWTAFDATANPDLPPPPPLPGTVPSSAAKPAADEPSHAGPPPTPSSAGEGMELDLNANAPVADRESLHLELFSQDDPPGLDDDAFGDEPGGLTLELPDVPAARPVEEPEPAKAEEPEPQDEHASMDLRDLPGIILPDHALASEAQADPFGESPQVPAGDVSRPAPVPAVPDPFDDDVDADADLAAFFESTAQNSNNGEQAVVIGDDFELLREGGDVSEVIADFRAATMEVLDLDDYQAHYDLGTTYMEMELFDESAAEFEIAARGENWALASREMLGYCFLRKGQIELAIRELRKGLEIPGHDERDKLGLLYNLGIACGVLDSEQDAIEAFQRILEVDPNFRDTRMRLERLVQNSS
jgi:tetratricopeptide (TPR) repeat protein